MFLSISYTTKCTKKVSKTAIINKSTESRFSSDKLGKGARNGKLCNIKTDLKSISLPPQAERDRSGASKTCLIRERPLGDEKPFPEN